MAATMALPKADMMAARMVAELVSHSVDYLAFAMGEMQVAMMDTGWVERWANATVASTVAVEVAK